MIKLEPMQQAAFEHSLPDGIHSKDQYLYSIIDSPDHEIGALWVQVKEQAAFLLDSVIEEAFRGRGYGKQTLSALDGKLRDMNVKSVGSHVFGDNLIAQELYKKAGFQITDIQMRKTLK